MKLYTKLQVEEIYLQGWYDGKIGFKDRIDDAISYQTPIELPSDEEMANASNHCKDGQVKVGFLRGVLWLKEQILNQNK